MALYHEDIAEINLNGGSLHRSFKSVSIGTGDKNANRFGMKVFRDGVPVDLNGVTCQAVFRDPRGKNIALTSHGTVSGNLAYVTLPQECYNYEGQFCLAIKLIGGGVTSTMRIVDGVINNTHTGGTVAPTGAVPTYQEVLAAYDDAIAAVEDVNEFKGTLKGEAYTLYDKEISLTWYQGSIGSDGKNNASNSRCRTDMLPLGQHDLIIFKPSTFLYYVVEYSSTSINDFVAVITPLWLSGDYVLAPVKNHYYRFVVKKADDSAFTPSDPLLTNISLSYAKDLNNTILDIWETVAIPANSDLNNYLAPGRYHSVNTSITETLSNCPIANTGFDLYVTKTSGHNNEGDIYIRQILVMNAPTSNHIYTRYIGQTFGEWKKITFKNEILDIFATVDIPANSDLNDYLVPGRYSSQNTATTKTLDNCPVSTTGFDLIVTKTSGHSGESDIYVRQLLMLNAPDTNYYYTRYIGQTYGEWQKISFEDDWSHNVFEPDSSALPARITGTEKKTINVCTFNVARYRHSNKDYLSEKPDFMMCLRRYIMNGGIDILFVQEHLDYIDESETKPSFDWLYKAFFNADPVNSGTYASEAHKKIFTTLPISTDGTVEYVECYAQPEIAGIYSKAYFVWVLQELQGVGTLLLIDVHNFASAQANSANTWKPLESRKKYLEALATFLATKTYDYCIIAGDFNSGNDEGLNSSGKKVPCDTPEDFEAILNFCSDNNMHPVNGGEIGWFKTSTQLAYDNILVTNNIRIEKIESDNETRKELYSDHSPILAKLTFML